MPPVEADVDLLRERVSMSVPKPWGSTHMILLRKPVGGRRPGANPRARGERAQAAGNKRFRAIIRHRHTVVLGLARARRPNAQVAIPPIQISLLMYHLANRGQEKALFSSAAGSPAYSITQR
jgi:hypothetical protein